MIITDCEPPVPRKKQPLRLGSNDLLTCLWVHRDTDYAGGSKITATSFHLSHEQGNTFWNELYEII